MDNTILVGKYLYRALSNDTNILSIVSVDKIFPLMPKVQYNDETGEEEDVTFPFVVYSRESLTPVYTKDMLTSNQVRFTIIAVSNDYIESLELANYIRNCLECKNYKDSDIEISTIKMDSISEETIEEAYIQKMTFSFDSK